MRKILVGVVAVMAVFAFVSVGSAGLLKHPPKGGPSKRYVDPQAAAAMKANAAQAAAAARTAAPTTAAPKVAPVKISGAVVSVNSMNGTVVVKDSMTGMNRTIAAGSKAVAGIKAGDSISATIDGGAVSITKK